MPNITSVMWGAFGLVGLFLVAAVVLYFMNRWLRLKSARKAPKAQELSHVVLMAADGGKESDPTPCLETRRSSRGSAPAILHKSPAGRTPRPQEMTLPPPRAAPGAGLILLVASSYSRLTPLNQWAGRSRAPGGGSEPETTPHQAVCP